MERTPTYDEKLARILKEATAIFAEKGFHQASIRDISAATDISLSGLYYYFRSKEELLFLIQDHCFGTILEQLDRKLDGVEDPEARLRIVVRNHLHFFVNNMREMKVLSHEADSLTGEYRDRVNARKRRYTERVREILEELRPEGSGIELRVATFSLFGMLNWIYNWYRPERDPDVAELAACMVHLFRRGYGTPFDGGDAPPSGEELSPSDASIWRSP